MCEYICAFVRVCVCECVSLVEGSKGESSGQEKNKLTQ